VGVPKVSETHKEKRRAQILEGAQQAFARHGYEGTTVTILEEVTGLSRGAIFNYFPNKQAIFLAVAVASSTRLTEVWLEQGFRALLEQIAHEDPDWLGVQLEAARRVHTDPTFQELVANADRELREHQQDRLDRLAAQGVRDDLPLETTAVFLSLVANGLALRRTMGDPMPDLDALAELVERGVAPRRSRKKGTEWKTPSTRTRPTPRSRRRSSAG
jgi:TetR/AcrR family transcriptional regulator, transcriptional repressor of aconitase